MKIVLAAFLFGASLGGSIGFVEGAFAYPMRAPASCIKALDMHDDLIRGVYTYVQEGVAAIRSQGLSAAAPAQPTSTSPETMQGLVAAEKECRSRR